MFISITKILTVTVTDNHVTTVPDNIMKYISGSVVCRYCMWVTSVVLNKSPAVTIETGFSQVAQQSGVMLSGEF